MSTTPTRRKRSATGRPSFLNEGSPEERLDRKRDAADMIGRKPEGDRKRLLLELDLLVDSAEPRSIRRERRGAWLIQFGGRDVRIRHSVGLERLATLLAHPGREFRATKLAALGATQELERFTRGEGGEGHDAPAGLKEQLEQLATTTGRRRRVKRRVKDDDEAAIRKAISEAESQIEKLTAKMQHERDFGSKEEAERIKEEIKSIVKSIGQYGKRGRERDDSSPDEKARKAVADSLNRAMEKIGKELPELAEYLDGHVRYSLGTWAFEPLPADPRWKVETDF